jgi:hypothetical protein
MYPILQNNIRIYRPRRHFSMTSSLICNQYQNIPISGFPDIGAIFPILGPPAPTSHRHWQQPPAGGRAGRRSRPAGPLPRHSNRPSLLILGTHRLSVDQGGYLVFTGPRRLRLLQKTQ